MLEKSSKVKTDKCSNLQTLEVHRMIFHLFFNKMSFDRILRINVRSATTMKSRICTDETRHADQIRL